MSLEIPKESKDAKVINVATKVISQPFNRSDRNAAASFILKNIGKHLNGINIFINDLEKEREKMAKGVVGKFDDFGHYYGKTLLDEMKELVAVSQEVLTSKSVCTAKEIAGYALLNAMKANGAFSNFNWKNYEILRKNNYLNLLSDFSTSFRGDIVEFHNVYNEKYIVIETVSTRKEEVGEPKFYCVMKNEKGISYLESYVFSKFEDALFYVMCPQYSAAMTALLRQSKVSE